MVVLMMKVCLVRGLLYFALIKCFVDENNSFRIEIKQRVAEVWHSVRSNQLLSSLYLETVRALYRLPTDGDFGYECSLFFFFLFFASLILFTVLHIGRT